MQDLQQLKHENGDFIKNLLTNGKCFKNAVWSACSNEDLDTTNLKMNMQGEYITFTNRQKKQDKRKKNGHVFLS